MKQMSHQQHHLHTGQVPTGSQQPNLHGQQLQINAQQQQQQHTMGHQQSHINMTPQQYGLSASHNANVAPPSMKNLPMAQQPQYRTQQNQHSQLQQQQQQQQQQYRQGQLQQVQVAGVDAKGAVQTRYGPVDKNPLLCVRRGCTNLAITSDDWEDEYCSNECAVSHCREVFNSFHKGGDP